MADKTISVRLEAATASYQASMAKASVATKEFSRNVSGMGSVTDENLKRVSRGALLAAGGLAVGLGLSAKAAVSWESAWAGVTKTVDGSSEQLATLQDGLRSMTSELPATHAEIAGVAEAAGQLGVRVGGIEGFTKVMVDLGETTNLTATEAATSLARLANIMGTSSRDVERMGSTIVDLGNNSATTEAEIVELATRLAAAGEIAGLTEADVLAFASTLTSVGVEAEAGGTALSKVFTSVRDAVLDGGAELETFAEVAGVSVAEFSAAFRDDAAGAIAMFVEGLGRMNDSGQSTTAVFEDLALTDQRLMRALLSTASAGDLLTEQLDMASRAWEENTALQTEAEKRYATTGAQLEILRNKATDLGITAGTFLLPALNGVVGGLGSMADGLAALPGPVQAGATGLAALATAGLGTIGILGTVGPKVRDFQKALMGMGAAGKLVGNNLGRITAGLVGVGVAVAAGVVAYELATRRAREYADMVTELRGALSSVTDGQSGLNEEIQNFIDLQADGLNTNQIDVLNALGVKFTDIEDAIRAGGDALDPLRTALKEMGHDLDGIDIGKIDNDGKGNKQARLLAEALGVSSEAVRTLVNEIENWDDAYQDAAKAELEAAVAADKITQAQLDSALATASAGLETTNYVGAMAELFPAATTAKRAIDDINSSIEDQEDKAQKAVDALAELVDAYQSTFAPFDAMDDALAGLADANDAVADAQRAHSDAVRGVADAQRAAHDDIAAAQRAVIDSAKDVEDAQLDVAAAMGIVADEAEAARRGIADLAAEQQASIDPLFAMVEAVQQLEDLKNKGGSTVKGTKTGENSGKLESQESEAPTAIELAQAAAGVQQAATRLAGAIRTGDVSLEDSRKTLSLWVAQGLITQQQADEVAKQFATVAARAEQLQGSNVRNAASTAIASERMEVAAERAKAVEEAQERLADAMEASSDAQDRLARAHQEGSRKIVDAQRNVERSAGDLARAEGRVARAAQDVMVAAINLNGALSLNAAAAEEAKRKWQEMADAGLITQRQADQMKEAIDRATAAAQAYAGDYTARLGLDDREFWERMANARFALAMFQIQQQLDNPHAQPIGGIPLSAGGVVPQYLAAGGATHGPRGTDTVPIWGTPGEYMMSKAAVDQLGIPYLDSLNSATRPADFTGFRSSGGGTSTIVGGSTDNSRVAHVQVNYPMPETASDSIGRIVRKAQLAMND